MEGAAGRKTTITLDSPYFARCFGCDPQERFISLHEDGWLEHRYRQVYRVSGVGMCFLPIHSRHQVRWTYQPGSHRRKVSQDFSSTFFLRCVPQFFSREGFSHSFPSSAVKSNFVYYLTIQSFSTRWAFLFCFLVFSEKNPVCRDRTHVPKCQRVTRYL